MQWIAYYRVSTPQQGVSKLGLDSQKDLVMRFLGNIAPIAEFTETESGKRHKNRPALLEALALCRKKKATLVIAKLDRLSRNVAFIATMLESDVPFVCCDYPNANKAMLQMMAVFAEMEREQISERIKAAMARIKAELEHGPRISKAGRMYTKLGGPNIEAATARAAEIRNARRPAVTTLDLMREWRMQGQSLRDIARQLNFRDIRTPQGSKWYCSTVRAELARMPEFQKACNPESTKERIHESPLITSQLNDPQSQATPSFSLQRRARGQKEGGNTMFDIAEANRMLDTFVGSGATAFDVTFIDIDGEKRGFRASQTARQLRTSLPQLIPGLQERQQNIIVRPRSDKVTFVQLDDLNAAQVESLTSVACLTLETSPGNHQAWIAVSDIAADAKDFARRLRKGVGADLTASGATRVGGTFNFKRKYEPDFPMVKILHSAPGRTATPAQLEAMGIVAAPEPIHSAVATPFRVSSVARSWPDYQRCVLGAPMKHGEDKPDISRADFFWAMMSAQRGPSIEEIAARLMEVSSKAQENGPRYAQLTAENAMAANERQRRNRA